MVAPFEVRADHASGESLGSESGEQDGDSFVPSGHPVVVGEDRARTQSTCRKFFFATGSEAGPLVWAAVRPLGTTREDAPWAPY